MTSSLSQSIFTVLLSVINLAIHPYENSGPVMTKLAIRKESQGGEGLGNRSTPLRVFWKGVAASQQIAEKPVG